MKTKEELNVLRKEIETLSNKLAELNDDELKEVIGGFDRPFLSNRHGIRTPLTGSSVAIFTGDDMNIGEGQTPDNWYGVNNDPEKFEPGSRFWTDWHNKNQE